MEFQVRGCRHYSSRQQQCSNIFLGLKIVVLMGTNSIQSYYSIATMDAAWVRVSLNCGGHTEKSSWKLFLLLSKCSISIWIHPKHKNGFACFLLGKKVLVVTSLASFSWFHGICYNHTIKNTPQHLSFQHTCRLLLVALCVHLMALDPLHILNNIGF